MWRNCCPSCRPEGRHLHPLGSHGFRRLWCATLAGAAAQWMERVALGWLSLQAGGDALAVGVVLAARYLPLLLLGPVAGTLADRRDRRRTLAQVALLSAALSLGVGALVRLGAAPLWAVLLIALVGGCVQTLETPARQSLAFDTVGPQTGPAAVALNQVSAGLMGMAGALAGGAVIPVLGLPACYLGVALLRLVGAGLVATMDARPEARRAGGGAAASLRRSFHDAARLVAGYPAVRTLVLAATTCEIFGYSYQVMVPVMARDVLRAGPSAFGEMTAASGLGATLAVLGLALLSHRVRREPLVSAVYLVFGAAMLLFSMVTSLPPALLVMVVIGACCSAFDALQQGLLQLAAPPEQRGRVVGLWQLSIGSAPIGTLQIGALAGLVGAPAAIALNGLLLTGGALLLATRAPAFSWRGRRAWVAPTAQL